MLDNVAAVVLAGQINDEVAETALDVASTMTADMQAASSSGRVQEIVRATTDVFRGVSRHASSPTSNDAEKLRQELKRRAGDFCTSLTSTTAPNAAPVGSASSDFLFSCQKVAQREDVGSAAEDNNQGCEIPIFNMC